MFGYQKKPIILPQGTEAYDPQEKEKKDWIKERTKKAEETAQAILEFLKQEDYLIVDIYNACQVIAKKMMDYVNKNTQEDIELVIKREQTKTLQQLYAAEQRK